jgi:hypothetical protein
MKRFVIWLLFTILGERCINCHYKNNENVICKTNINKSCIYWRPR